MHIYHTVMLSQDSCAAAIAENKGDPEKSIFEKMKA